VNLYGLPAVASSQVKRSLSAVFSALLLDIASDDAFVHASRTYEVTYRPNTVKAPIDPVKEWKLGPHVTSGIGLDQ
jgi:hypothetical protein